MPWNPAVWIAQNWMYLAGWVVAGTVLWRLHRWLNKLEKYGENIDLVRDDMNTIKTNHLAHIQSELETTNETLSGLREDFKEGLGRLSDSLNVVLTRIK